MEPRSAETGDFRPRLLVRSRGYRLERTWTPPAPYASDRLRITCIAGKGRCSGPLCPGGARLWRSAGAALRVETLHGSRWNGAVEGGFDNRWRMVSGKLVRAEELVTGKSIPDVRTSGPLTESDIPADAFKKMKGANNPPWNKLPSGAQRMRSW